MKNILFLALVILLGFTACQKKDLTLTRVGFYVIDPNFTNPQDDGYVYSLYIDNQYDGELKVSLTESMDSTLMNFKTLDAKKHIIEVKKQGTKVSSTYLQIEKCGAKSGTANMISSGKNGATFQAPYSYTYTTYGIFQ